MDQFFNLLYLLRANIFFDFVLASITGLILWLSLYFNRQLWVNSFHVFLTYILLPIITYVITKIISNNIALALGMVGALSIVRFRNPVKSPFELVMYFALITMGISLSVNREFAILFAIFISITIFVTSYLRYKKIFLTRITRDELESKFYLEVTTTKNFSYDNIQNFIVEEINFENENEFIKRFACNNKKEIVEIKKFIYEKCSKNEIKKITSNFEN